MIVPIKDCGVERSDLVALGVFKMLPCYDMTKERALKQGNPQIKLAITKEEAEISDTGRRPFKIVIIEYPDGRIDPYCDISSQIIHLSEEG